MVRGHVLAVDGVSLLTALSSERRNPLPGRVLARAAGGALGHGFWRGDRPIPAAAALLLLTLARPGSPA